MSRHVAGRPAAGPGCDAVRRQYGALPFRKDRFGGIEILLVTSRRRGRWIVPKGWPVKGRTGFLSAAVEAFEEAGVVGQIYPRPVGRYHYVKRRSDGALQRHRVTLFALRVRGTLINWPERGQRRRRWMRLDEATRLVAEPELAGVLRAIRADRRILTELADGRPSLFGPDSAPGGG